MTTGRTESGSAAGPAASRLHRVSGFSPWEEEFGFSRAVVAGDFVLVAGSTAYDNGVVQHEGDPYHQTLAAFGLAFKALAQYGLSPQDVVRTRLYLNHVRDCEEVGRAHKHLFDTIRPVTTMVVVDALIDSRMMVEVEVEAYRPGLASTLEGSNQP